MLLSKLSVSGFKNYQQEVFAFKAGINCLVGKNGVGKTNLLDAIHYLALAKSAINPSDSANIQFGEKAFVVRGEFEELTIACGFNARTGKTLKVKDNEIGKLSDHVGTVPLVFTTPDDADIIREGNEFRRKFFDGAISQVDRQYLSNLISYNKILRQRNEHLKGDVIDHRLLDTYDAQMLPLGKQLSERRAAFIKEFTTHFESNYLALHHTNEQPGIAYETAVLNPNFESNFKNQRDRDMIMKRTLQGAHRDAYVFSLNDQPIKKFGSQGQQKTFIISLRLAEFDFLKSKTDKIPVLLLDDIFDKLDDTRISALVNLLDDSERFDQIFITDARKERSKTFFHDRVVNFIELK